MRVLTQKDVGQVVQEVGEAAGKWHEIGTAFRMSVEFLEELKGQEKGPDASLLAVVTQLLGGANARPNWAALRDVLKSESVGEQALAERLDAKYSQNPGKLCDILVVCII